MKRIVILGTGGNAIDILDTLRTINTNEKQRYHCVGFLDDAESLHGQFLHEVKVLGPLAYAANLYDCLFVNGIGNEKNFWKKSEIINKTGVGLERFATIVHPSAQVSVMATVGAGCVILQNVTIASQVKLGNHVIVLPNSVISHDTVIGDYGCIAGGVSVSGGVTIGQSCYLGTQCAIKDRVTIGAHALIGMGSVVLNSVDENQVMVGNPAKYLRTTF